MARMAHITRDDVAHVARLARLRLTDDELDTFTDQLARVLDHARDAASNDLTDVPPTHHPYPPQDVKGPDRGRQCQNVMRPDEVRPSLDRDEVLAAAPAAEDGQFRVPPVLGEAP